MTILTLAAIRENPWNAVYQTLPDNPDRWLLRFACLAADYCEDSELNFVTAMLDPELLDDHLTRRRAAGKRLCHICELYERLFGAPIDDDPAL